MRASLEAMLEGTLAPTPGRLTWLHAQTGHLLHLTGDLRLLSLADAGDLTLDRCEVDVARLLAEVAAAFEDRARQGSVTLGVRATPGPPALLDPVRLTQVLHNLTQNALNHTPAGGAVELGAELVSPAPSPGNGLGLGIARTLVEAHGGTLTLDSRVGRGTVATVRLPQRGPA